MLSCALLWFLVRSSSGERASAALESRLAARLASSAPPEEFPRRASDSRRVALAPEAGAELPARDEQALQRAEVVGQLLLDGGPPAWGRARLRDESAAWDSTLHLLHDGRFRFVSVPSGKLALAFELEPSPERLLLLPEVALTLAPGRVEELRLDWTTRELNVRVLAEREPAGHATVELVGPGHDARFETDENGKARLLLVGGGRFLLRATLPSGARGEATLELDDSDQLESVLIATRSGR